MPMLLHSSYVQIPANLCTGVKSLSVRLSVTQFEFAFVTAPAQQQLTVAVVFAALFLYDPEKVNR